MLKIIHNKRNKFQDDIEKPCFMYLFSKSLEFNPTLAGSTGTPRTLLGRWVKWYKPRWREGSCSVIPLLRVYQISVKSNVFTCMFTFGKHKLDSTLDYTPK